MLCKCSHQVHIKSELAFGIKQVYNSIYYCTKLTIGLFSSSDFFPILKKRHTPQYVQMGSPGPFTHDFSPALKNQKLSCFGSSYPKSSKTLIRMENTGNAIIIYKEFYISSRKSVVQLVAYYFLDQTLGFQNG